MTNVACERLTIPPRPVTTTNDRKMIAKTMPLAMMPCSYASAWSAATLIHCNVNATSAKVAIAHGSRLRHAGSPAR